MTFKPKPKPTFAKESVKVVLWILYFVVFYMTIGYSCEVYFDRIPDWNPSMYSTQYIYPAVLAFLASYVPYMHFYLRSVVRLLFCAVFFHAVAFDPHTILFIDHLPTFLRVIMAAIVAAPMTILVIPHPYSRIFRDWCKSKLGMRVYPYY